MAQIRTQGRRSRDQLVNAILQRTDKTLEDGVSH